MITFKLEEQDFFDGYWLVLKWSSKGRGAVLFATLSELFLGGLLFLLNRASDALHSIGWAIMLCVAGAWGIGISVRVGLKKRLRTLIRASQSRHKSTTYSWDAAGIHVMNIDGEVLIPWSALIKWRQNKKVVVIYRLERKFIFFPKRFFSNEIQINAFLGLLSKQLGAQEDVPSERSASASLRPAGG